ATSITVTQTSSNFLGIKAYTVSGANTSAPFDSGGPRSNAGITDGASDTISITTHNANAMIICGWRFDNTATPSVGTVGGTTATQIAGLASSFQLAQELVVSSINTYSCKVGTTGTGDSNGGIVDAIVAATATGPIGGWRNNSVDQVPARSQTWLRESAPQGLISRP